jgi:hypothetical protein
LAADKKDGTAGLPCWARWWTASRTWLPARANDTPWRAGLRNLQLKLQPQRKKPAKGAGFAASMS